MNRESISKQILEKSKELARKKTEEEINRIQGATEKQIDDIKTAIEMINKGFYYKGAEKDRFTYNAFITYVVVDEEILMEDYLKSLENETSWNRGLEISKEGEIRVGNERYIHIGKLAETFDQQAYKLRKKIEEAQSSLQCALNDWERFTQQYTKTKSAILNYQKLMKRKNKDE